MTRTKILAAAAAVLPIILFAAGTTFRDARHDAPQPSTESNFEERWISIKKSDRLPVPAPMPFAVASAQSDVAPPVAVPSQQLSLATEDDIRQAEAEHHRHRNICPRGRTYFTIEHHQYWRCKL
jgi:hypothetical protein